MASFTCSLPPKDPPDFFKEAYPIFLEALKKIRFQTKDRDGNNMDLKTLLECDPEHVAEGFRECGILASLALRKVAALIEG